MCFFPVTRRRNLDIRQHAENTNNITTPPSSTDKKQRATPRACGISAVYCCGYLLYRRLRSVISHHRLSLSFAVLCMLCQLDPSTVARVAGAQSFLFREWIRRLPGFLCMRPILYVRTGKILSVFVALSNEHTAQDIHHR